MGHFGYRNPLPENMSSSISVLPFCVATVTHGRARGTTKAGHLQLLEVTTWRKVTRGGAAEILAAPAPVARQTKVKRGRGPKEQEKEKEGEVPQHDAGGLVGPTENPEQQRGQLQCNI